MYNLLLKKTFAYIFIYFKFLKVSSLQIVKFIDKMMQVNRQVKKSALSFDFCIFLIYGQIWGYFGLKKKV